MLRSINYNNLKYNYSLLKINRLLLNNRFIIFFFIMNITNTKLYEIKNELLLLNIISSILNNTYVKLLFNLPDFNFLNSQVFSIYITNINDFIIVCEILKNIEFFYLFENSISNITNGIILSGELLKNNNNNIQKIIINKIYKILILLILFNITLIQLIK